MNWQSLMLFLTLRPGLAVAERVVHSAAEKARCEGRAKDLKQYEVVQGSLLACGVFITSRVLRSRRKKAKTLVAGAQGEAARHAIQSGSPLSRGVASILFWVEKNTDLAEEIELAQVREGQWQVLKQED